MKKCIYLIVALPFLFSLVKAQYNKDNLAVECELASDNYTREKLRLYPITANRVFIEAHKNVGDYKPLKEALEDKSVKIIERGAVSEPNIVSEQINEEVEYQQNYNEISTGDEVNRLFIENSSQDTVFILAGEVIKGGKQDRVIAQDMVIPPNSGAIDLSVFCVEKGRWTYGGNEASDGFTGYSNITSSSVRKVAITEKSQTHVWAEVEEVTTKNGSSSNTSAYTALEANEKLQEELKTYSAGFSGLPAEHPNVIGVVAVTGDRIIGCDMFATPDLFRNAFPGLLESYATEAITNGKEVKISDQQVQEYISKILSDEEKQKEIIRQNGAFYENNGKVLHFSTF